jgi:hypothetical protein
MRVSRYLAYAAAIGFFLVMQGVNVARQARFERLSGYSRAVVEFLGMRTSREQYLLIYYQSKPVGYSGYTVYCLEAGNAATYRMALDGYAQVIPWLGAQGAVALRGEVLLDSLGEIMSLDVSLELAAERFRLTGTTQGSDVLVKIARGEKDLGLALSLPRGIGIAGAMMPIPPLGELKDGETREIPYFDPLTQMQATCSVHVRERSMQMFEGVRMEVLHLEVAAPAGVFHVTAGLDGEVLRVEAPAGIELRQSTSLNAHRLFKSSRAKGTQ